MSLRTGQELVDQPERWPVESSEQRFTGRVFAVRTDRVRMGDGRVVDRDVVTHTGSVGVIALDADRRVLVVRQYRHATGYLLWEAPAGLLDVPGEDPLAAAQRELYEEGHCRAADWRVLVDVMTSPGMTDESIRIYLARDLTEVPAAERYAGEHEEADMPVGWVPVDELVRRILGGHLHNPTLISGVLALRAAVTGDGLDALRPPDAPWPQRPFTA